MIDAADRRRLEAVLKKLRSHEGRDSFPPDFLADLRAELAGFTSHPAPEVAKLADLQKHLTPNLTARTFTNLIVPVERALQKNIKDEDFLVASQDHEALPAAARLPLRLVLDNLRSAFNVGSLLRTSEGLGLEHVHLTGYSAAPTEDKTSRATLGAHHFVPWSRTDDILPLLRELKKTHFLIALETAGTAKPLTDPFPPRPTVLILGNERFGVEPAVLELCDEIREIPLKGVKNSLNVAVAGAVAAFEWSRQWR
ncbi:MAG: TrmH family RNA methyltransferase [Bdellovibrionaceae bacterium]|nr:TrmH family RNA methyltransferase [Pseudobdellovibrionaceae bacterium]